MLESRTVVPRSADPMRVLFVLIGDENKASSRVRGYWVARELKDQGAEVELLVGGGNPLTPSALRSLLRNDVVVLQKSFSRWDLGFAALARVLGLVVIFDIDDHPAPSGSAATIGRAGRVARLAHAVTAGSQALVRLFSGMGAAVHFHPTCVRPELYRVRDHATREGRICLGWIGNGRHYSEDLCEILLEPLRRIASEVPVKLRIVGAAGDQRIHTAFGDIPGLEAEIIDQIRWDDPAAVHQAVSSFDIGLFPLRDTAFNQHKCAFKALEYMAMGIPVVASPVGGNSEIVQDGRTGFLATSADEWFRSIRRLCDSPQERRLLGAAGRSRVETDLSCRAAALRMLALISSLRKG